MKKLFFIILIIIFVSGCYHLTPKGIIKNPDRVVKECGKIEDDTYIKGNYYLYE